MREKCNIYTYFLFRLVLNYFTVYACLWICRCGSDAVVGYWDDTVTVIGRLEDSLTYVYYSSVVLRSEIDCVKIISGFQSDLIQPVPQSILNLYRLDSTSSGSYLLEASKQFEVCGFLDLKIRSVLVFGIIFSMR